MWNALPQNGLVRQASVNDKTSRLNPGNRQQPRRNALWTWRKVYANKTQSELGADVGLNRYLVADMESGLVPLWGRKETIIRWATACRMDPTSVEVQEFLIQTGNAPYLPEGDGSVKQVAELSARLWRLMPEPPISLSLEERAIIESHLRDFRRQRVAAKGTTD